MTKERDPRLDPLRTKTKILSDPSAKKSLEEHGEDLARDRDRLRREGAERRIYRNLRGTPPSGRDSDD